MEELNRQQEKKLESFLPSNISPSTLPVGLGIRLSGAESPIAF
jgi:hypothetical protein